MSCTIIGMAACCVDRAPNTISTLGLGSCIGLTLYDPRTKIGGMVHIVMPESPADVRGNPEKFADTGVDFLIAQLARAGAGTHLLQAKMAGGSQMFAMHSKDGRDVLRIGERNIVACKKRLLQRGIHLMVEDVGGSKGRTIELNLDTGLLMVRVLGQEKKYV